MLWRPDGVVHRNSPEGNCSTFQRGCCLSRWPCRHLGEPWGGPDQRHPARGSAARSLPVGLSRRAGELASSAAVCNRAATSMSRVWYALTPGPRSTLRQSGLGELAISCCPRWGRRVAERFGARRLPAFQSSPARAWPGSTPRLPCCGRSRTLRLGSAKRGKLARPGTVSHSAPAPAPASAGRRLITGPKDATPAGGWNWMIGVRYRIKASASPVVLADSRIGRSVFEPRQPVLLAGLPGRGRDQEGAGAAVPAIGMAGIAGGVEQAGADGRVPRPDRVAAVLGPGPGGDARQFQPGGVTAWYPGGKWLS
jgi:hypothetical protein